MIKVQNIKTGEILEFGTVKEWEHHILIATGKEKINKGHLYNVINGKSKSCYGFKLANGETPIPQTPKKEMEKWKNITIHDIISVREFVEGFLQSEYNFELDEEMDFGIRSLQGAWGFFSWNVGDLSPTGIYVGPNAINAGQNQAKGTLIHEALHLKLFLEKKRFSDGQEDFEKELEKLSKKYPEYKITSNHDFKIIDKSDYKTFINKRREKYGIPQI